ncbi:MAG TPA: ComEA family DNA-binding protein [Polyangiaceae bacterium]|nr:ComEA family DNA-binding protein [Polyangiaceae bacterium]
MALDERTRVGSRGTAERRVRRASEGPGTARGRGRLSAVVHRLRASTWAPLLGKALGVVLGMLVLAAIGAFATKRGVPAHSVALAAAPAAVPERPRPAPSAAASGARVPCAPSPAGSASAARSASPATAPPADGRPPALTEDGKVILNRAGLAELQKLPGVGAKRAQAILALREKLGRFRRVQDLLRVRGIGPKSLKKLAARIVLDDEPPKPDADTTETERSRGPSP